MLKYCTLSHVAADGSMRVPEIAYKCLSQNFVAALLLAGLVCAGYVKVRMTSVCSCVDVAVAGIRHAKGVCAIGHNTTQS
jgi:hypothetical protein